VFGVKTSNMIIIIIFVQVLTIFFVKMIRSLIKEKQHETKDDSK